MECHFVWPSWLGFDFGLFNKTYNVIFSNSKISHRSQKLVKRLLVKIGVYYNKMCNPIGLGNLLRNIWLVRTVDIWEWYRITNWEMILYHFSNGMDFAHGLITLIWKHNMKSIVTTKFFCIGFQFTPRSLQSKNL